MYRLHFLWLHASTGQPALGAAGGLLLCDSFQLDCSTAVADGHKATVPKTIAAAVAGVQVFANDSFRGTTASGLG